VHTHFPRTRMSLLWMWRHYNLWRHKSSNEKNSQRQWQQHWITHCHAESSCHHSPHEDSVADFETDSYWGQFTTVCREILFYEARVAYSLLDWTFIGLW